MGGLLGSTPSMPEIKMPPPPPPPAPMEQPEVVEALLDAGAPSENKSKKEPTGKRYRARNKGMGKGGGSKKYKGGGLNAV